MNDRVCPILFPVKTLPAKMKVSHFYSDDVKETVAEGYSLKHNPQKNETSTWQELQQTLQHGILTGCGRGRAVERCGLRMAVLTTLVRLLELKAAELEGPDGTGPLEDDISLLQGLPLAASNAHGGDPAAPHGPAGAWEPSGSGSTRVQGAVHARELQSRGGVEAGAGAGKGEAGCLVGEGGEGPEGGELAGWLRACVVYRAGQKRLARGYLRQGRAALAEEMKHMLSLSGD